MIIFWFIALMVLAYALGLVHGATFLRDLIDRPRRIAVPRATAEWKRLDEPACRRRQLIRTVLS